MITLSFPHIDNLKQVHYAAVLDYVTHSLSADKRHDLYLHITQLPGFNHYAESDYGWLKSFILADTATLREWTNNHANKLRFNHLKDLYLHRFSNGADSFVDTGKSYNAYTLFDAMDIHVCPYCEHEFLDEVDINGKRKRTLEFDHFYPKGDNQFPGLAMCFFNLIPSCIPCNKLKLTNPIAANPYDADIESLTYLYPDIAPGANMEALSDDDCAINFHPSGDMILNEKNLALEQRYYPLRSKAHDLLRKKQQHPDEQLEEMERMGFGTKEQLRHDFFGDPRSLALGKQLHTKMKHDLIGY